MSKHGCRLGSNMLQVLNAPDYTLSKLQGLLHSTCAWSATTVLLRTVLLTHVQVSIGGTSGIARAPAASIPTAQQGPQAREEVRHCWHLYAMVPLSTSCRVQPSADAECCYLHGTCSMTLQSRTAGRQRQRLTSCRGTIGFMKACAPLHTSPPPPPPPQSSWSAMAAQHASSSTLVALAVHSGQALACQQLGYASIAHGSILLAPHCIHLALHGKAVRTTYTCALETN